MNIVNFSRKRAVWLTRWFWSFFGNIQSLLAKSFASSLEQDLIKKTKEVVTDYEKPLIK